MNGARASSGPPITLETVIEAVAAKAVQQALAPYIRRLVDPEPLVDSVREAAHVLGTSQTTVRRLIDDGVLPSSRTWASEWSFPASQSKG